MSDSNLPFAFSQFVPGFDFLKNLSAGAKAAGNAGAVPGIPSLSSWVAPTLSVEEVDKRIQELKTVQYWLEQNGHALKATIQALEVQKMTLSTLRGMNLQMEDLAQSFTRAATAATATFDASAGAGAGSASADRDGGSDREASQGRQHAVDAADAAASSGADRSQAAEAGSPDSNGARPEGRPAAAGVVDPLQWWGALTQQFQQIASSALQDASQLKMPAMAQPMVDAVKAMSGAGASGGSESPRAGKKSNGAKSSAKLAPKTAAARSAARKAPAKTAAPRQRAR
ncbi:conserved hypothetical protein [Burkholderiales bacterium 8X]|nr:conserved hypothetical protein [Burkholderiales bacterium 8X]